MNPTHSVGRSGSRLSGSGDACSVELHRTTAWPMVSSGRRVSAEMRRKDEMRFETLHHDWN